MRVGILAGETSGDILGAHLLSALRERCPDLQVEGMGGPLMAAQGLDSMFPMERLSVMGFVEPLKRLPELLRMRGTLYRHFRDNPPDIFLGIDSPDFTLHLEQKLRRRGIRTAHLVSPSVWAWRRGRIRKIRRAVDLMLTLFPFEAQVYRDHGIPVEFVGHPLADALPIDPETAVTARRELSLTEAGPLLSLLPGSRGSEVRLLAPLFLETARRLLAEQPDLRFVLPAAGPERRAQLAPLLARYTDLPLTVIDGSSQRAMAASDAVLLASGTATLEAMLLKKPMAVAYRMAPLSWAIISRLVSTPFAALPNILAGRKLVPEHLQRAATPEALVATLKPLLRSSQAGSAQREAFTDIHRELRLGSSVRCAAALARLAQAPPVV